METHLVGRNLSGDYLVFVLSVAVAFNLYFVATRRWKELIVFNIGGGLNLAMEALMISSGKRTFSDASTSQVIAAILCLGWVTNGFVCSLAYINIRQWLTRTYPPGFVLISNVIYFVALPAAMFNRGFFDGSISTVREMGNAITYIEPALLLVFASVIYFKGYRQLLWRLLLVGFLLDFSFESSLFISGVRPVESFDIIKVGGRVLFEMNTMFCFSFLALKGIFGLNEYSDRGLESHADR